MNLLDIGAGYETDKQGNKIYPSSCSIQWILLPVNALKQA